MGRPKGSKNKPKTDEQPVKTAPVAAPAPEPIVSAPPEDIVTPKRRGRPPKVKEESDGETGKPEAPKAEKPKEQPPVIETPAPVATKAEPAEKQPSVFEGLDSFVKLMKIFSDNMSKAKRTQYEKETTSEEGALPSVEHKIARVLMIYFGMDTAALKAYLAKHAITIS